MFSPVILILLTMVAMTLAVPLNASTPVILDTDIGDDIDDSWALALLLRSPELDVKLITVAHANTPVKAKIVAKYLELVGRTEIPIAVGRRTETGGPRLAPWVEDYAPTRAKIIKESAAEAICRTLRENPGTVLVPIGPLENVADAIILDVSAFAKARIVAMSGSVALGYGGVPGPSAEWNVRAVIPESKTVYGSQVPLTIAPLDTCGTIILDGDLYQEVLKSPSPYAKHLIEQYRLWIKEHNGPAGDADRRSSVLFDTAAIVLCLTEKHFEMRDYPLEVNDEGYTLRGGKRSVRAALFWRDKPGFLRFVAERIAGTDGEGSR